MTFSAVILAGGESSRMGQDKAWLKFEGQSLLARQLERVRTMDTKEIFISGRADTDYSAFGAPVLLDEFGGCGPLAGIERALAVASSPLVLVLAVDLAGMSTKCLRRLVAACGLNLGVIPRVGGAIEPLAAIYPRSAYSLARAQLVGGKNSARAFAAQCVAGGFSRFAEFGPDAGANFINWNSPADLV